jgi:alanine-synthesizing transaminase
MNFLKSNRLNDLRYEIRGPVYEKALELESQGYKIISLNIGNPAPFGFDAPDEIVHDIILNIRNAQGYSDSRGLFAARKAVMHYTQNLGIKDVAINDVFIGNGVSELILLTMQALINEGDEVWYHPPIIRSGRLQWHFPAENRFIICVTNRRTGTRIWQI